MIKPNTFVAETSEHAAILSAHSGSVAVYRKAALGTLVPIGRGLWSGGTILGSDVNCGVLVRLEQDLRAQTGTP